MKKPVTLLRWLLLLCPLCCTHWLHADTATTPTGACDTLFTTDGKMYLVRLLGESNGEIRFTLCDDASGVPYALALSKVQRTSRPASSPAPIDPDEPDFSDPLVRKARTAALLGVLASVLIFTVYFSLPALIFAILAVVNGEKLLRKMDHTTHAWSRYIRRKARRAVFAGMLAFMLPFLLYFLLYVLIGV